MGIAFVLLLGLMTFLILAPCLGLVAMLPTWLLGKKKQRGKKMLLAFCPPPRWPCSPMV